MIHDLCKLQSSTFSVDEGLIKSGVLARIPDLSLSCFPIPMLTTCRKRRQNSDLQMIDRLLHKLPPETAHKLTVKALVRGYGKDAQPIDGKGVHLFDRHLPNRVGLAAGFDVNAKALSGCQRMGFGFVEAGTVTIKPRSGNGGKHMWRIGDDALISWPGFPNVGLTEFTTNLAAFRATSAGKDFCVGANIHSPDGRAEEMRMLGEILAPHVDFLTVNVSCPNTGLLRNALGAPAREVKNLRMMTKATPILIKLEPNDRTDAIDIMVEELMGAGANGFVACGGASSFAKKHIGDAAPTEWPSRNGSGVGDYSGPGLLPTSLRMIRQLREKAGENAILIGSGGVQSPEDLASMIDAGADAVQVMTAVIRGGRKAVDVLRAADAGLQIPQRHEAAAA